MKRHLDCTSRHFSLPSSHQQAAEALNYPPNHQIANLRGLVTKQFALVLGIVDVFINRDDGSVQLKNSSLGIPINGFFVVSVHLPWRIHHQQSVQALLHEHKKYHIRKGNGARLLRLQQAIMMRNQFNLVIMLT